MTELVTTARALVADGKGILAADESTGTMDKRLTAVGVAATAESRRQFREIVVTTPGLDESISGVILFDETFRQSTSAGTPIPRAAEDAGMLPGIKVDTGAKPLAMTTATRRSPKGSTGCASGSRSTSSSAPVSPSGGRSSGSASSDPRRGASGRTRMRSPGTPRCARKPGSCPSSSPRC